LASTSTTSKKIRPSVALATVAAYLKNVLERLLTQPASRVEGVCRIAGSRRPPRTEAGVRQRLAHWCAGTSINSSNDFAGHS
jgi:hypothetical protein